MRHTTRHPVTTTSFCCLHLLHFWILLNAFALAFGCRQVADGLVLSGWPGPYYAISSDYVPAASRFIARATQDYASDDEKTFFSFKKGEYFVITCANPPCTQAFGTPAQRR